MSPHKFIAWVSSLDPGRESEAVDLTYDAFDAWREVDNWRAADSAMCCLASMRDDSSDMRLAIMLSALTATLYWSTSDSRDALVLTVRQLAAGRTGLDSADALLQGLTKKVQR